MSAGNTSTAKTVKFIDIRVLFNNCNNEKQRKENYLFLITTKKASDFYLKAF